MVLRKTLVKLWISLIFISILLITILHQNSQSFLSCAQVCSYSSKLVNGSMVFDSSYKIEHYPDFVCSQNFRNLADWIYGWPSQFKEEIETMTQNAKLIAPCLPDGSIIYVRIWALDDFFISVYPHLINNFVLITGEGDFTSPNYLKYLERSDSKIIHWFGQNGQYDASKSSKFTHIPIGINCDEMAAAIKYVHSKQSNYILPPVYGDEDEPKYYIQPLDVSQRKLNSDSALIHFDRTGLSPTIWKDLCMSKNSNNYPFIICFDKEEDIQMEQISVTYELSRQYPFWLSPRANGLDYYRTWEALYLDIIPIVMNSSLNILYQHLPVVIINHYKELNETFLRNQFNKISEKKLSMKKFYQYDKLRHAYWRRLILNKSRHRNLYQRERQCWRATGSLLSDS